MSLVFTWRPSICARVRTHERVLEEVLLHAYVTLDGQKVIYSELNEDDKLKLLLRELEEVRPLLDLGNNIVKRLKKELKILRTAAAIRREYGHQSHYAKHCVAYRNLKLICLNLLLQQETGLIAVESDAGELQPFKAHDGLIVVPL